MRTIRPALLLAPISLLVAACATVDRDEVAAPANGGAVALRVGTPLVVSLPPDPDTGYGWVLRSTTPNLPLIGGPDYTPQPRPPGLVGVADTTAFRFRATETGTAAVEFAWVVPPGAAPRPERVVRYDVTIGPNLWLATDFLGTLGIKSARTPGNSAIPADTPASSGGPDALK